MKPDSIPKTRNANWLHYSLACGLIVLATLVSYHRTFNYPFHFDGQVAVQANPDFQKLDWDSVPTQTRQLVDLTWQLNYVADGGSLVGYHVVNIAIHVFAGLLLFAFVDRTLQLPSVPTRYREPGLLLAAAIAILWVVHPLQTQSVTYIVQRYESLMGMFFLLAMVCLPWGASSTRGWPWYAGGIVASFAAVLCKEVAIVLPLVMLWYDRAFLASSWRQILRQRGLVYVGVFASWLILAQVIWVPRSQHAASGVVQVEEIEYTAQGPIRHVIGPKEYLFSQAKAIPFYLRLTLVPDGQSLDHGWRGTYSLTEAILPGLVVMAALGLTGWAVVRSPQLSFVGGWFFLILAPTSSILPIKDIVFEHRMYLPLAAPLTLIVLGLWEAIRRLAPRDDVPARSRKLIAAMTFLVVIYGGVTLARNEVYRSDEAMWLDVIAKNPMHERGYHGLAHAYILQGDWEAAIPFLEKTMALNPNYPFDPYYGESLFHAAQLSIAQGNVEGTITLLDLSIRLNPSDPEPYFLMAQILQQHSPAQSVALLKAAIKLDPDYLEARELLSQLRP
ncbi:hypothetical protein [Bremerella cremea]|uniref:tetratricopeptide repeat protein n=1 Tax=Bremerella cremea TaxID=1031537 RepID=UPI0031F0D1A6